MKVLWLCFGVITDFCDEFGLKENEKGGWIPGLLHQIEKHSDVEIGFCFPVTDEKQLKDGILGNYKYYSIYWQGVFKCVNYTEAMVERFKYILNDFKPDIVHIWGSEFPTSTAMVKACEELSILDKAVVNIQGLHSIHAKHFYAGVPEYYQKLRCGNLTTLEEEKNIYVQQGKCEIELFGKISHTIGRTDWDKACALQMNPKINYYFCNEVLRDSFYENTGKWKVTECERNSIFISQGQRPLKGLHYLLHAMPIILKKYPNAKVYVAGRNLIAEDELIYHKSYAVYLKDLIDEFRLSDKIVFLGKLGENLMIERYLKSHVYVSASSIENSPNSVCEAMLMGVPVVSSYVGGVYNLLTDKVNGFLYQYDAPYMLAYYICQIFGDDELAIGFSKNASESMKKIIDKKVNSARTVVIYEKIKNAQG